MYKSYKNWSTDTITNDDFRTKFITLPEIIDSWVRDYIPIQNADVLDFGCGEGIISLGFALRYVPRRVVGVDIMPDPERCLPVAKDQIGIQTLPNNLELHRVQPGSLHNNTDRFDIIYSWSVFEHIDERVYDEVLDLLYNALKPNGLLFVQIAPLYYSAEGSHLCHKINEPWGHLLNQQNAYYEKLASVAGNEEECRALWSTYRTLNRITADEMIDSLRVHGFKILNKYTTNDDKRPPSRLKAIFNESLLMTNQVVVLVQKKQESVDRLKSSHSKEISTYDNRNNIIGETMSNIHVFTSSAVNYLPKVRLLCESIKKYHPEVKVHWALADRAPDWLNIQDEQLDSIIHIDDLDISNVKAWIFGHTIAELSTAIKPFVMRYLLDNEKTKGVLYFDPDIVLFSRLDDLIDEFKKNSILLTPHQTKPEKDMEAIIDNEICSLRHGIFNLGFLGIRNDNNGRAFIDWWADRLYHFCHESLEQHLWTDQKWANFAPVFFNGVRILKSSRFNVAPWNITTRHVSAGRKKGEYSVDGKPLGFYHFTGFDSGAHKIMAMKYGGANPAIMRLVKWYEKQNKACRDEKIKSTPWGFSQFDNGKPIKKLHRIIYRMRKDLQEIYPDPFATHDRGNSYYKWFQWRASLEHPDLVTTNTDITSTTIDQASSAKEQIDWRRVRIHLKLAIKSVGQTARYAKRSWWIVRNEGISGLKCRLSKRN